MINKSQGEEIQVFVKGQILFNQGEPGGDLFFIQEGKVSIFRVEEGQEVNLASMGPGEVIGIMTCLSNDPRMASAKAETDLVAKVVRHENVKKLVSNMPNWMNIVLKDYYLRLGDMNKRFSASVQKINSLKSSQINPLYTGKQMAASMSALADHIQINIDEKPVVLIDTISELLELTLKRPEEEINAIMDIFIDAGMLKIFIEQDKKRKYVTLNNAKTLNNFADFVEAAVSGKTRKLIRAAFTGRELRVITSLIRFANSLKLNLSSLATINVSDLQASMEKVTGNKFEYGALDQANKVGLLELKGGEEGTVNFVPIQLSRTLAHIRTYKSLAGLVIGEENNKPEAAKKSA